MGRIEEFLVIVFLGILIFKPSSLKDVAGSIGGALNEFKKAMNPEGQNVQTTSPQSTANQPVYVQTSKPVRRRKSTGTRKKSKTSR